MKATACNVSKLLFFFKLSLAILIFNATKQQDPGGFVGVERTGKRAENSQEVTYNGGGRMEERMG